MSIGNQLPVLPGTNGNGNKSKPTTTIDLGSMGTNITGKMVGSKLFLEIDVSKSFGASTSGKSITVATTSGNREIPGTSGIMLGINAYKKAGK